ncbi:unnamed protein product [Strongylus vulgaris]|uniref:Uncharacterized protein n=1 Tax=Strongylus vulgaris TaxID=40348 RepID=A0A3P7JUW0_STRVU|nr:unnamed protein product [Strongylus vulgaris]
MESISDFKKLISLFPPHDAQRDTYSVFGSKFASILFENVDGNAVTPQAIDELARLHRSIMRLKTRDKTSFSTICLRQLDSCALHPIGYALEDEDPVLSVQFLLRYPMLKFGDLTIDNALVLGDVKVDHATRDKTSFSTICLRQLDSCALHPIGYALEDEDPVLSVQFLLRYPMLKFGDLTIDNALVLGDVKVDHAKEDDDGNAPVISAKAIRLFYLLEPTMEAERWIEVFLEHMIGYHTNSSHIFYTSSKSLASEMERNGVVSILSKF